MNDRGNFDVSLSPEHFVTVEAHQDEPHGPELAVADSSLLGKSVKVEKSSASKAAREEAKRNPFVK
jgi:hypothetical protein